MVSCAMRAAILDWMNPESKISMWLQSRGTVRILMVWRGISRRDLAFGEIASPTVATLYVKEVMENDSFLNSPGKDIFG